MTAQFTSFRDDEYVCTACINDDGIRSFIEGSAESDTCSFCGATSDDPIAAPVRDVARYMEQCLAPHFEDPANSLPYESAEGGYQGTTYSTQELLCDVIGLDLPNDADGRLLEALVDKMENTLWSDTNPFSLSPVEQLLFSWESFCELIKHKKRYFFLSEKRSDREIFDPAEILRLIFSYAEDAGLVGPLAKDTILFRARHQPPGHTYQTVLDLGPPPIEKAVQTNRMSPPGIVMMYVAEDVETALAETANAAGDFVVATFKTEREALILDLTQLPRAMSIFEEIPDSLEYDPRPRQIFLRDIAHDISKPIARDDRVHVEYVPTQVVTEYLRTVKSIDGRPIEGIRFKSSRNDVGNSIVLFADQTNLLLPESEQPEMYGLWRDRWLNFHGHSLHKVTDARVHAWNG
jgi:hypothetical protein